MNTTLIPKSPEWFENWFDSEYYHLLYDNRNHEEADLFVSNLLAFLKLPKGAKVMDLACGKGRHSYFLNASGLDVLGVDLSSNSISEAKEMENESLHFKVGDMREPQAFNQFEAVFNLFTSFGYFETEEENLKALDSIFQSLKPGGLFVIDFFNTQKVLSNLIPKVSEKRNGIEFLISKSLENEIISKKIQFYDLGKDWFFEERVQALTENDFRIWFEKTGFTILSIFGDYNLHQYNSLTSDRMIFLVRKPG